MNKIRIILSLIIIFFGLEIRAQDFDVYFQGNFKEVPFSEFVRILEQETEAQFFFLGEWVDKIEITTSGDEISLQKTLSDAFLASGLNYYIDKNLNVFISREQAIVTKLPDYSVKSRRTDNSTSVENEDELSKTEQQYIEGKKSGIRKTLIVGSGTGNGDETGAVIYGKMVDVESGEPLIGATIYVLELKKGAVSDVDGRFSIVLPPGMYTVDFNCMGMAAENYYLDVKSGGNLDIAMNRSMIPLNEVVIEANRFHNVRGTQMGFERLNVKTIKEVPIVLGEKDLLKVAQMLPGVQSVGEGATGFNVRGSAADQNMIYVKKVPIYNSSHMFGFFSSINPDIVKDFSLYKSNVPAAYGGRLSSFFDISTRQGNMNEYTARGGISPITGHIAVEGPIIKNKSAFIFSARSTYSDWILKQMEDPELRNSDASFYDLAGTMTFEPNDKNLIKTFGYYSKDKFNLGTDNQYEYSNAGASIDLSHRFNSRISADLAAVFGEYAFQAVDKSNDIYAFSQDYRIDHFELKADLTWLSLGRHKLSFGGNSIFYDLQRGNILPYGEESLKIPVNLGRENGLESAIYFVDEFALTPRLTIYGGLRYNHYLALGPAEVFEYAEGLPKRESNIIDTLLFGNGEVVKSYSGLEPRIAVNYLLGADNSVKFSYNRIRQFIFMLSNTIAISPVDQWKLSDYNIVPPYVDQVSAGYYHDFRTKGISTSLEIYHKWVSDVIEYRDGADFISSPNTELVILQGDQRAYGVELMVKKNAGKFNGWISYSYSRSLMYFNGDYPGESINDGNVYPSNYDRPHNLSVVSNYKINRRLSLSSNLVYITGRPVTYPISVYYQDNIQNIHYSDRNAYRIPDYFRIDLSINLEGNLRREKLAHSFWMLNVYNLTGRKNAYSVYFKNEDGVMNGYKLSIFGRPIITLSWNFKFGNYASE